MSNQPTEAQPTPTDAQLLKSFTKHSGGPNPYYRCNECGETEPGLYEYLSSHWLRHRASKAEGSAS